MAEFDPYHKWLAIPPMEQPPNLYRLLALNIFESDSDVIDSAANARMIHLRSLQSGPHVELTQRLLNEIAAARLCLLKPEKKAAYDATLRSQIASRIAATAPPPLPLPQTNPARPPATGSAAEESSLLEFISATYDRGPAEPGTIGRSGATKKHSPYAKKADWPRILMIVGPLIGIGVVAAAIALRDSHDGNAATTASRSTTEATGQRPTNTAAESSSTARPIASPRIAQTNPTPAAPSPSYASGGDTAVSGNPLTQAKPGSIPSRTREASPASEPMLPTGAAKVQLQYHCTEPKLDTNQVRFQIQIENDGDVPLRFADLKVRYWFASAADKPRNFWCDYAAIGKDNVTGRFAAADRPTENAAGYLELAFSAAAGEINPGANSGEIQCRFAVDDWSNVDQSNDYSFEPAATQWTVNPHVAVYQNSKLMWGHEPVQSR